MTGEEGREGGGEERRRGGGRGRQGFSADVAAVGDRFGNTHPQAHPGRGLRWGLRSGSGRGAASAFGVDTARRVQLSGRGPGSLWAAAPRTPRSRPLSTSARPGPRCPRLAPSPRLVPGPGARQGSGPGRGVRGRRVGRQVKPPGPPPPPHKGPGAPPPY